jgi:uncharacterized membrane protein YtjA (UPF0391 family)
MLLCKLIFFILSFIGNQIVFGDIEVASAGEVGFPDKRVSIEFMFRIIFISSL